MLKYMEIENLVCKAKLGSAEDEEKLYYSFIPYINLLVSKFNIKSYTKDDLRSECYLALNKAIKSYNGTSTFVPYATKCLKNHVLLLLRNSIKLDEIVLIDNVLESNNCIEEDIINKLEIDKLSRAIKTLSPKEQKIIQDYFFNDLSLVAISKVIDKKYITTVKTKDRAINKLKELIK